MQKERTIFMPNGKDIVVPFTSTPVDKGDRREVRPFLSTLEALQSHADLLNNSEVWQSSAEVSWNTDRPLQPILPLADLHLGHRGVNYEALKARLEWAKEFDAKLILLGDLIDGFTPSTIPSGMIDQAPIQMQVNALKAFLSEYQDRILCNVSTPHHDGWVYQATGVDIQRVLTEDLNIPLIESGGELKIIVNGIPYDLSVFHKIGQYNSSLNLTNASKRVIDKHTDADFVLSGHVHKSSTEVLNIRGKRRGLVVVGTLKGGDKWGRRQGFVGGVDIDRFPIILLRTDRKDFEIIDSPETAGELLDGIQQMYRNIAQGLLA